ncbi:glutathione S-transferase kappa 1-like [Haliotis rubra]|uniref:glutathione S-transferase kappa 1-like n=1 Tax=Haliotis rubra TaxID=36100 RepID=UPI001EE5C758|nr:glutathione S-transferase kappa 1-like [Haliotis rubra]
MSAKKRVELFYDVVSPYSWFAFEVLCRYRASGAWNINLQLRPFFLGGVMQGSENKPPATVPNKAAYMSKDLQRMREFMNVPLNQPANFVEAVLVKGSLQAMRFLTVVDMKHPDKTEALSRELWMRIWSRDEDITQPDSFIEAGKKAGLSDAVINDALGRIKDQEIKDMLKQNTQDALDYKAFGAPIIIAHVESGPELIFGADRFDILARLLGEEWKGPVPEMATSKL